jgi:MFS family permease
MPVRLRLIGTLCLAEVLGMLGFSAFAALLPLFIAEWSLSNTEAGWISGVFFGGYTLALAAVAAAGFAWFADGFWSAMLWRGLAGVGLAGTYMPGLKLLSDHLEGAGQSRAVAFYTSSFGIGAALSFLIADGLATRIDWTAAFLAAAIGAAAATLLVAAGVGPGKVHAPAADRPHLLDFRPVLRNRATLAYSLCYATHNYELFGLRSWVVAFLVFAQVHNGVAAPLAAPTTIAAALTLIGVWASVFGNELSLRYGRRRVVAGVILASSALCFVSGFASGIGYGLAAALVLLHGATVAGESASVTAGAIGSADPRLRGATMALHSTLGFAFAFLGPLGVGVALDLAGGESVFGWGIAFASMGAVMLCGLVVLAVLRPGGGAAP